MLTASLKFAATKSKRGNIYEFSCIILAIVIMSMTFTTIDSVRAAPVTFTPSSSHHKPVLRWAFSLTQPSYPYAAGFHSTTPSEEALYYRYDPINPSCYWTVEATRITVSFPDTPDPSVIGNDNWLAAGMFVHSSENGSVPGSNDHADWAYYTVIVLDSLGNLWLDVGIYWADESNGFYSDEYIQTWQIGGVSRSTPLTLTAAWNALGFIYWTVIVNGVLYRPLGAEYNMKVFEPTASRVFYVGWNNIWPYNSPFLYVIIFSLES